MLKLLLSGDAAARIGVSRQTLHTTYLKTGRLKPIGSTEKGFLLFDAKDVAKVARDRKKKISK